MRAPAVVGLIALVAAGCATKADVQLLGDSIEADLAAMRADQAALLAQIRGELDSLDAAGARRESTGRGEFERRVRRLEDIMGELLEVTSQSHQLLLELRQGRSAGPQGGPAMAGPGDPGPSRTLGADSPSQFYGLAQEQFRAGNLETARNAFRDFLSDNPRHELAPDAQYYIARTYEDAGDMGNALAEYQRVTELYPDSNRAPAALYRRGLIEAARGNTAVARRLFTQVETGYPNSPEAPEARRELRRLGGPEGGR